MAKVATLTVDYTKVSAALTDFVLLVKLAELGSSFWSLVSNGGGDIRVRKADGTLLPREVVFCDTGTSVGELWVKYTGTLSNTVNTDIQIWCDGSSTEPTASAPTGKNAVWTDYDGVWHFNDDPTSYFYDSTKNARHLTTTGMSSSDRLAGGPMGGYYSRTTATKRAVRTDYVSTPTSAPMTLQCWVKPAGASGLYIPLAVGYSAAFNYHVGMECRGDTGGDPLSAYRNNHGSGSAATASTSTGYSTASWQLQHSRFESSVQSSFINGGSKGSASYTGGAMQYYNEIWMGYYGDTSPTYNSSTVDCDEARLRSSVLSDAWIATEYANQGNHNTFYSIENHTPPDLEFRWFR